MRDVVVAVLFRRETEDEAVGESVVESFGAIVGSPLKLGDRVDLLWQGREGVGHTLDLFLARFVFELENHNVSQHLAGAIDRFGRFRGHGGLRRFGGRFVADRCRRFAATENEHQADQCCADQCGERLGANHHCVSRR